MSSVHMVRRLLRIGTPKKKKIRWLGRLDLVVLGVLLVAGLISILFPAVNGSSYPIHDGYGGSAYVDPGDGGGGGGPDIADTDILNLFNGINAPNIPANEDTVLQFLAGTKIEATVEAGGVRDFWGYMVLAADAMVAFIIMLHGYRIIFSSWGLRYAEAIESLPRVILAIIGVHASRFFVAFWIAINNVFCYGVYSFSKSRGGAPPLPGPDWAALLTSLLSPMMYVVLALIKGILKQVPLIGDWLGDFDLPVPGVLLIETILQIVLYVYIFLLILQCIVRIALINLLIIVSPLGMIAWALPEGGGKKFFNLWVNALVATVMVQAFQMICYGGALIIFGDLMAHFPLEGALKSWGFSLGNIPAFVLRLAAIWLCLRIPGWFQQSVTNTMGAASSNAMGVINQTVSAVTQGVSAAVGVAAVAAK